MTRSKEKAWYFKYHSDYMDKSLMFWVFIDDKAEAVKFVEKMIQRGFREYAELELVACRRVLRYRPPHAKDWMWDEKDDVVV
jgi:hypothetical protein